MTDKSPSVAGSSARFSLIILLAVTVVSRVAAFGTPILYTDEEFYFAVGGAMANGAVPFLDIWDRKPVGLFLIYAVPGKLGLPLGIWFYQIMAFACVVSTAWLITRIAAKAGWERGSTMAGAAYALWVVFAGGQGGQSPIFYNALMALAALYILNADGPKRRRNGLIGMSLVGLALQIKYSVVFEGIFFGLWLVHREWRQSGRLSVAAGWGTILAAAALMPTVVATLVYAEMGHLPEFVFASFQSILARNGDPIQEEVANILKAGLILAPLVTVAFAGGTPKAAERTGVHGFLRGWLAVSLLAFAILPPWTFHYTLPVVLPACTLAAGSFSRPDRKVVSFSLLLAGAIAGQVSLAVNRSQRGTPHEFARLVDSVGRGPGCLYVYSSSSMLYPATGRCAVSRYVFPSHLTRAREAGAIGVDQASEIRHVFSARPEVVVVGPPYDGERPEIRSLALELLAQSYRLEGRVKLGRKRVSTYRLRERPSISAQAVSANSKTPGRA